MSIPLSFLKCATATLYAHTPLIAFTSFQTEETFSLAGTAGRHARLVGVSYDCCATRLAGRREWTLVVSLVVGIRHRVLIVVVVCRRTAGGVRADVIAALGVWVVGRRGVVVEVLVAVVFVPLVSALVAAEEAA